MTEEKYTRDVEESDEVLDALGGEAVGFWEEKQRELVTSTVDYNLGTLTDLVTSGSIHLSPEYQRRFRWDPVRQSRLIESFLMNVPVPPIFLNEDDYGSYSVIDGKQRLTAIHEFLADRLKLTGLLVFADLNGRTFGSLPADLQSALKTRPTLRSVIILRQSDLDVKNEVFHRLNTGGVRLNAQEVRNNAYPGPLNDLIQELSQNETFHGLLHIRNKERSSVYREMRDAEFVLRFLTFEKTWETFTGGMELHMDAFMKKNLDMSKADLTSAKNRFLAGLTVVEACFDEHCFQRWMPERRQWRRQVLAALYDAQMFGTQGLKPDEVRPHQKRIVKALTRLFSDQEFRRAIDAATNTPSYFRTRIGMISELVRSTVG